MTNISERAAKYAENKAFEAIEKVIAQAYIDGYCDGCKDSKEDSHIAVNDSKTEFVDLGLPSGTLWATDYEKSDNGERLYVPYGKTAGLKLPTKEQWEELCSCCEHSTDSDDLTTFVGPNGNILTFEATGWINASIIESEHIMNFWMETDSYDNDNKRNYVYIYNEYNVITGSIKNTCLGIDKTFSGYKLPVRLVQCKQ